MSPPAQWSAWSSVKRQVASPAVYSFHLDPTITATLVTARVPVNGGVNTDTTQRHSRKVNSLDLEMKIKYQMPSLRKFH